MSVRYSTVSVPVDLVNEWKQKFPDISLSYYLRLVCKATLRNPETTIFMNPWLGVS